MTQNNFINIKGRIAEDLKQTSYYGLSEYSTTLEWKQQIQDSFRINQFPLAVSEKNYSKMKDIIKADTEVLIYGHLRNKRKPESENSWQPMFIVAEHVFAA